MTIEFKFGIDELMTIAGENTPEKIAQRLLEMRQSHCHASFMAERFPERAYHRAQAESLAARIAADEDRLMTLVLDGKTRLERTR